MRSFSRWFVVVSLIALGLGAGSLFGATAVQGRPQGIFNIYADALDSGWADWSWGATVNLGNPAPVHGGTHAIAVSYTAAWGALYLHANSAVSTSGYETLRFFIHGGSAGTRQLRVVANGDPNNVYAVAAAANMWTQIDVPLGTLGSPVMLTDLYWQDTTGGAQPMFYLDDIQLIGSGVPPAALILSVNAQADQHPISPYIYGMNFADEALATDLNLPVRRWGGNSTSRYNWQIDVYNTGSDWYFENITNIDSGQLPAGSAADQFVEQDRRTGAKTIMTAPLMGWVSKRRVNNHPYDCGFKRSVFPTQQSFDPYDSTCGNGLLNSTTPITGNDPFSTSLAITSSFVASWVNHLTGRYGTAANGGVLFYDLDNEPMLWNSTQRDVHPLPTTYDELRDKTYAYAAAIKQADPSARTLGPVLWGWCAYYFSAKDGCNIGSDYISHTNTAFVPWYLQQMQAYEQAHGVRLVDYLDLHYYPQADGVALSGAGSTAIQALRLRSTRSLWDPSYVDESWIGGAGWQNGIVKLIPRMKDWVTANYTGTKLAITEYNWGGLDHINGAIAQADVLGIFGREGLDLATLWGPPTFNQPGAYAFRMYRNYDGQHHTFGDVSVRAASTDQGQVAVYAARRSTDNALTIMVINKSLTQALTGSIVLSNTEPITRASVYHYGTDNLSAIMRQADQIIASGSFSATFPAQSITLFVTSPNNPLNRLVFLPVILK